MLLDGQDNGAAADSGVGEGSSSPAAPDAEASGMTGFGGDVAGRVTTVSTALLKAAAKHEQQRVIKPLVKEAINRLEQSEDSVQIEKARELREANRPPGLQGLLHPDAVEYDLQRTLEARERVLSDRSVIGNKLTAELSKVSDTVKVAETVSRRAGIVGTVVGR